MKDRLIIPPYFAVRYEKIAGWIGILVLIFFLVTSCKSVGDTGKSEVAPNSRESFKNLFHEAMSEKMIGHYDRAVQLFEQCLSIEQDNATVHFALADLYELQGNLPKSIQFAKRSFELDQTNKWFALKLAQLYYKTGDYTQSATYFELGITEDEQSLELKYQYAEALINSNQFAKAIVLLDEIEVETGKFPELTLAKHDMYLILNQPEKANQEIQNLLLENPKNIEIHSTIGYYFLESGKLEQAKEVGEKMLQINPQSATPYFFLADCEMEERNVKNALNYFETAYTKEGDFDEKLAYLGQLIPLAFNPAVQEAAMIENSLEKIFNQIYDPLLKNISLHTHYAAFLLESGNPLKALEQYRILVSLGSVDYSFWKNLLELEFSLNQFSYLSDDAEKALELFPAQAEMYRYAAIGNYKTANYDQAEEFLFLGKDIVVNNSDLLAEFYIDLGTLYALQKRYGEGYGYFEEAKKLNANAAKAFAMKGLFLFYEGKINESKTEIDQAVKLNPKSVDVIYVQGIIFIAKKNYKEAVDILATGAALAPKNISILELYGDALFLNGQKEDAQVVWKESQRNGNNSDLLRKKVEDNTYYEN